MSQPSNKLLYSLLVLQILCAALLTYSLLRPKAAQQPSPLNTTIFQQSIYDAAQDNQEQDRAKLFAINSDNDALVWQVKENNRLLKVLAWMSQEAYDKYYACDNPPCEIKEIPATVKLWVTLVPQLKDFCTSLSVPDKSFRLKQYLGLNPSRRYETFVEFWVNPDDLLRPCPDPETFDTECNLQYDHQNPPTVKNIANYTNYFDLLVAESYQGDGAPWTRLGYTYDWSYGRRNIGASEYILVPNAQYQVNAAYSTAEYCANE